MDLMLRWRTATAAFDERDHRTAIRHLTALLDAEPTNRAVRELLARAHYHSAHLGRAEELLRALVADDPTNSYAALLLARTLERRSQHDEAAAVRRHLAALTGDESDLARHAALVSG